jgi:hypothetical protein
VTAPAVQCGLTPHQPPAPLLASISPQSTSSPRRFAADLLASSRASFPHSLPLHRASCLWLPAQPHHPPLPPQLLDLQLLFGSVDGAACEMVRRNKQAIFGWIVYPGRKDTPFRICGTAELCDLGCWAGVFIQVGGS